MKEAVRRNNRAAMIKSRCGSGSLLIRVAAVFLAVLVLSVPLSACSSVARLIVDYVIDPTQPSTRETLTRETTARPTLEPTPTPVIETAFSKDLKKLSAAGIKIPLGKATELVDFEDLMNILASLYEGIAGDIDISMMNPEYQVSEGIQKLTRIGVFYDGYFLDQEDGLPVTYSSVFFWLFEIYNALTGDSLARPDSAAYAPDLTRLLNISVALSTWQPELPQRIKLDADDYLPQSARPEEPLTRLDISHILVGAYEDLTGVAINANLNYRFADAPDEYARKAAGFFIWPEGDSFLPDLTGSWDDTYFLAVHDFDFQLRNTVHPDDDFCPYGALISAAAALLEAAEPLEFAESEEIIVLNERPYPWHVYQLETGEYGSVNCMPSCIEMAMRFQELDNVPSAESLRNLYPLDGQGWNDYLAESLMFDYGLNFYSDYVENSEDSLERMLSYLDQGNILYVMYIEDYAIEGHAVILKGYRQRQDELEFIVCDPDSTYIGPFGYPEYLKDARIMTEDIMRHVPRYFVIPPP